MIQRLFYALFPSLSNWFGHMLTVTGIQADIETTTLLSPVKTVVLL